MEQARVGFGNYAPDLPALANPGLAVARNTVPISGGYKGVNALSPLAGFNALPARPRGAIAGIDSSGNPFNVVGTELTLQMLTDNNYDVTRTTGGAYNCQTFWEFAIFQKNVLAVNLNDDSQYFDLVNPPSSMNFKQLGNPDLTGTVAPRAAHVAVIGSFIVMGNTFDAVNGRDETAIHWSAVNDPFNWPTPGTEVARAVQSDRQPLQGDGGAVQGVIQGAEVGAIFQERAVWRADYRGGDVVFELNRVEPLRGLLVPAIAVPFGRRVFYLAEDGFYLFDYTESVPIGREIIDRTFLADIDLSNSSRVSAVSDPGEQRIWVLYPGAGNVGGVPNKYLCYDWGLNRFSHGDEAAEWLTQAVAVGRTLDSSGTSADPDDLVFSDSFDDRIAAVGDLALGAYDTAFKLSDFSGSGVAAVIETGRRELAPGRRALASRARVLVDAVSPTVQVAGHGRAKETALSFSRETRIDEDGDAPLRVDARYHTFRINLPSGFDNALGFDIYFKSSGHR